MQTNSKRKGFSLIEILVYTAIIGVVGTLMNGILISILKIQNKQVAITEVHQQMNFVIHNIQRFIRESDAINMTLNEPGDTLTLTMSTPEDDPTLIYKSGSEILLKEGGAAAVPLTTNDVTVEDLEFTRLSSATGYDAVEFTVSISYSTQNPQSAFTKTITSAVAHPNLQ